MLVLAMTFGLIGSTADAQSHAGAARRTKVSAVTQASYDEDVDPAPELDYQPSSVSGGSVTYPRYEDESAPQRIPQSRLAHEIAPRRMPHSRTAPENITAAPTRNMNQQSPPRAMNQRPAPPRAAPHSHTGRPARFVAQRTAAPPVQPTPKPAAEPMILPAPNESRAAVHPMDNPFDDMDMPIGGPVDGSIGFGEQDGWEGGDCAGGSCGGCHQCCCFFGPWLWDNISLFGGVQGFKAPVDLGTNGNFGFHAGINWAFPVLDECGIGFQLGTQGVYSDLSGTTTSSDARSQNFTTLGLFHRPACGVGMQYGVAWDYLHDDYARAAVDLSQFRAEISLIGCRGNEIGFWTAVHTNDQSLRDTETANPTNRTYQATDMYALFYRRHFCNGAWARFSGGFTNDSDGVIGADAMAPFTQCLALNTNFNYLIPNEGSDTANSRQESWGLTISLVWYPACSRRCGDCSGPNPYRPLFGVADNTTFIIDRQ